MVLIKVKGFLKRVGRKGGGRRRRFDLTRWPIKRSTVQLHGICTAAKSIHMCTNTYTASVCQVSFGSIGSIFGWGCSAHITQPSERAGGRRQRRLMLLETMQLQQKHPSSDMLTDTHANMQKNRLKRHHTGTPSHPRGLKYIERGRTQ